MNIYQLFMVVLGKRPNDGTLAELEFNTVCGLDCSKAIYAARAFMECSDESIHEEIIQAANHAVEVYWRG